MAIFGKKSSFFAKNGHFWQKWSFLAKMAIFSEKWLFLPFFAYFGHFGRFWLDFPGQGHFLLGARHATGQKQAKMAILLPPGACGVY